MAEKQQAPGPECPGEVLNRLLERRRREVDQHVAAEHHVVAQRLVICTHVYNVTDREAQPGPVPGFRASSGWNATSCPTRASPTSSCSWGRTTFAGMRPRGSSSPGWRRSSGVEIQATAASNILDGKFLIKDSFTKAIDISLIFFLTLVFGLVLFKTNRTLLGLLVLLIFLTLHFGSNIFLFSKSRLMLSILFPAIPMLLTYILYEVYRNIVIERQSKFLRSAFSSYVSPDVVDEIILNPEKLSLGGDRKKITLLFSDIRGFTTLSEKTDPEKLVTLLNEYLSPMTEIVMRNKGTLDKFIGDAVMAIYGAPVKQENQAFLACISAVEMIEKLKEINTEWAKNNLPNIDIGIGINTGEAVVGNMGADIRFDYTAIGDTVNLAARLEGQTKFYGTNIIISETTKQELELKSENSIQNSFRFRELDIIKVKGKTKPIAIFQLIIPGDKLDNDKLIDDYNKALSNYRSRNFTESLKLFKSILENLPGDVPSTHYVDRNSHYINNPPSAEWDYVYTAESK